MKNFFSRYKKLHIWLLVLLFLLALFLIFRTDQDLMNWLVTEVTQPMKDAVASVCYLVSFPVIEILYILAGAWVVLHIVVSAVKIHRSKGHRRSAAYRSFLILLCVVLTVETGSVWCGASTTTPTASRRRAASTPRRWMSRNCIG